MIANRYYTKDSKQVNNQFYSSVGRKIQRSGSRELMMRTLMYRQRAFSDFSHLFSHLRQIHNPCQTFLFCGFKYIFLYLMQLFSVQLCLRSLCCGYEGIGGANPKKSTPSLKSHFRHRLFRHFQTCNIFFKEKSVNSSK